MTASYDAESCLLVLDFSKIKYSISSSNSSNKRVCFTSSQSPFSYLSISVGHVHKCARRIFAGAQAILFIFDSVLLLFCPILFLFFQPLAIQSATTTAAAVAAASTTATMCLTQPSNSIYRKVLAEFLSHHVP